MDGNTSSSRAENEQDTYKDHSDYYYLIIGSLILIMPLILIRILTDTDDLFTDTTFASDGFVFIASTGILTRLLLRSSLRVTVRAGIRGGLRASGRTAIRSAIKDRSRILGKSFLARYSKRLFSEEQYSQSLQENLIKLVFTMITLVGSFMMVTYFYEGKIYFLTSLIVLIPIGIIFLFEYIISERIKADYNFYFTFDGLILQLIFSLGMSFIPLANDTFIDEDKEKKAYVSIGGWLGILILSVISILMFNFTGLEFFDWLRNFSLLFLLVISIPIDPLEGKDIYDWKPWFGVMVLAISLILSLFFIGEEFSLYI
ncbi:MAG: hypothetical protein INQ03_24090 [Candidatus Heimdallarchaeota archaeon]|nr:hypothetical protein [Candidatus Heimdallarchaeota archaeon]